MAPRHPIRSSVVSVAPWTTDHANHVPGAAHVRQRPGVDIDPLAHQALAELNQRSARIYTMLMAHGQSKHAARTAASNASPPRSLAAMCSAWHAALTSARC